MDGYRVTLTFVVPNEAQAWEIADGLEQAAIRKDYREANGYVTTEGRGAVLVDEGEKPILTQAETAVRRSAEPTGFGVDGSQMITLGGEHGESG